jgi:hypothetical protein
VTPTTLLHHADRLGVTISRSGGRLSIRGPKTAARAILAELDRLGDDGLVLAELDRRRLVCAACRQPLDPAAAVGGHTTHPACDLPPPAVGAHTGRAWAPCCGNLPTITAPDQATLLTRIAQARQAHISTCRRNRKAPA